MQFFQNRIKKKAEIRETHFPSQFGFVRSVGLQVITQLRSSRNQPPEASASVLMEELISIKKSGRDLCYFFGIGGSQCSPKLSLVLPEASIQHRCCASASDGLLSGLERYLSVERFKKSDKWLGKSSPS
jgi:hypothetical protein